MASSSLQLMQTLEGHTDRVWHLSWSPDGRTLASCSADRTVRIWQRSRQEEKGWRCAAVLEDTHTKSIRCCCWSPGGTHLATASFDGTTAIWEVQNGYWEEVAKLEGHENEVKAVAWSPCGNYIATCGRDKTVWFWESVPGNEYDCMDVKTGHSQDVKCVAWHPSRELLASCSYDDSIKLWMNDDGDWICLQTLEGAAVGHTSTVWSVAFSRDGFQLASVSADCTLRVWRLSCASQDCSEPRCTLTACISGCHKRPVYSVDWSADGVIATGDGANAIKLFGQPTCLEIPSSSDQVTAADSIEKQEQEQLDKRWQQQQQEVLLEQPGMCEQVAAGHGDHGHGTSATLDEEPWDYLCAAVNAHEADVNCVRWHPLQPHLLASCGDDNVVKLWTFSR